MLHIYMHKVPEKFNKRRDAEVIFNALLMQGEKFDDPLSREVMQKIDGVTADSDADIYLIVSQDPLHKLIVVDRVDMLSLDAVNALNKEINKCRNTWMLMCRNTVFSYDPGVGFSRASDKILVTSKRGEYLVIHDELS